VRGRIQRRARRGPLRRPPSGRQAGVTSGAPSPPPNRVPVATNN
jgi:hypothetical protein